MLFEICNVFRTISANYKKTKFITNLEHIGIKHVLLDEGNSSSYISLSPTRNSKFHDIKSLPGTSNLLHFSKLGHNFS